MEVPPGNGDLNQRDTQRPRERPSRIHDRLHTQSFHVLRENDNTVPSIELKSEFFKGPVAFMLDTGAQPNIVKKGCINDNVKIDIAPVK